MHVLYRRGVHLPGPALWLDPLDAQPVAVVSHAHADHIQRHEYVLASAPTAAMMRLRGMTRCRFQTLAFGEPATFGSARVTLYPAGHILGSAQVLIEWDGVRLLYSGDFKLRPGRSTEAAVVPEADIVVMETTYGLPRYRFPEPDGVVEAIQTFCRQALDNGETPVLFCYSLGKGQEVLACLEGFDAPVYLHPAHWQMADLYRNFGARLPAFQKFQPGEQPEGVLLCAYGCRKSAWFGKLRRPRTAYISGWAVEPGARWRFGTDAAFPLSDHADYDELFEYVRRTGARRVYTVHGFAEAFAADLRRAGIDADALPDTGSQLQLF